MPETTTTDAHVAVLAFPFSSHAAVLLSAVGRLATSAPNTLFSFFSTAQSNNSIFAATRQPNLKAYNVWDGVPEGHVFSGCHQEDINLFMETAPQSFRKEIEVAVAGSGRRVSCLVTDAFLWFGAEIAEEIRVPWIPCWTSASTSLTSHVLTDLIRETINDCAGLAGREDETLSFVPEMSKIRICDLPTGILFGNLESVFHRMLHRMGQMLPQAAAVFGNSFEELEPDTTNYLKTKLKSFLSIGPFNLVNPQPPVPDTFGCLSWLDKQKPASVAYIAFGSVATPPPAELVALAEALETSKVPFIWVLKDSLMTLLPKGLVGNGKVLTWAPQQKVLGHNAVGLFITHGGWNSVLESIAGGVPMICRPFFGDHSVNARMVEAVWEMGVTVKGGVFTREELLSSMDLILVQEKGKKMRERVGAMKEAAERAVGEKGSSTQNFMALLNLISS
ncbi:hypothetical protein SLE2022_312230 [Rubroshorea leprosula]